MGVSVRFVNIWTLGQKLNPEQVVFGDEIRTIIATRFGRLKPLKQQKYGEVANRWSLSNGYEIGFIESISKPFVSHAQGQGFLPMVNCMPYFPNTIYDLKSLITMGADIKDLRDAVIALWRKRDDRYSG